MLEGLPLAPTISTSFGIVVLWAVAWLVITRRLVWHKDLAECKAAREKWEALALRLLESTEKLTVHAEVTNDVLAAIPVAATPTQEAT